MESELIRIYGKPTDFKVCKKCKAINWYENDECHNCNNKGFTSNEKTIKKWCEKEFGFWIKTNEYTERETEDILYAI